jgi:hypothetical protein
MKIYIPNIPLTNIKNNIHKLEEYQVNKSIFYELNSLDYGIHIIDNNNLYRIEPNFEENIKLIKNFNGRDDLLLDMTTEKKIPVFSQMPTNYILTKIIKFEFTKSSKSNLKLIINCINSGKQSDNLDISNNEEPIDFYFFYDNSNIDITNAFFQDELNMFLSILN